MYTRWADEHPDARQDLVDPTVKVLGDDYAERWALAAGWVGIVNALHAELLELLGNYEVERVTNKMSALRYAVDSLGVDRDVWREVNIRIAEAKRASLATCDLCGGPALGTISVGVTRCVDHPATGPNRIMGATARPPGWSPLIS